MNLHVSAFPTPDSPWLPWQLALRSALRAARRGWRQARALQRRAAIERDGLRELHAMDDRMLADIGLSRCNLPWVAQRGAYAQLLEDVGAFNRAWGVHAALSPASPRS